MSQLNCIALMLLVTICGPGATTQPNGLLNDPVTLVQSLYHQVLTRHPTGLPQRDDMKAFTPYLSKRLLHSIDLARACASDWARQDQKRMSMKNQIPEKAPFGWVESGIFSGADERTEPDSFVIERTESEKDGSIRVYVRLALSSPPAEAWEVAVVLEKEDGRLVADDVIYLKDKSETHEVWLSKLLSDECDGSRYGLR
jgi:hypothetical protein